MKTLRTEIIIKSPINKVWNTLMDFSSFSEWNSFIPEIKGNPEPGETLQVQLKLEGQSPMTMKPKVLVHESEKEFRWLGSMGIKGIFDGEHYFQLEAISANETRFVHGENFSGILSGLIMKWIGKKTENGFKIMNQALKTRAESLS